MVPDPTRLEPPPPPTHTQITSIRTQRISTIQLEIQFLASIDVVADKVDIHTDIYVLWHIHIGIYFSVSHYEMWEKPICKYHVVSNSLINY